MRFKVYHFIQQVEKAWKTVLNRYNFDESFIYQSYEFNKTLQRHFFSYLRNIERMVRYGDGPRFVVAYENNIPVCIAPLIINTTNGKEVRLLGHGTNAGYLDFIYSDCKFVKPTLEYCMTKYAGYCFNFIFVKNNSPLVQIMDIAEEYNNYAVSLEEYSAWFSGLSKHAKQNIRTAYNRIDKDEKSFGLKIYRKETPELSEKILCCNELYFRRRVVWKSDEGEYSKYNLTVFPQKDVIYAFLRKYPNAELVTLEIDEKISAFFIALVDREGVCVPRLAIDSDNFFRYSPGLIVICEYLKKCTESENRLYRFDLGRGDEGYKSVLNGQVCKTYRLKTK